MVHRLLLLLVILVILFGQFCSWMIRISVIAPTLLLQMHTLWTMLSTIGTIEAPRLSRCSQLNLLSLICYRSLHPRKLILIAKVRLFEAWSISVEGELKRRGVRWGRQGGQGDKGTRGTGGKGTRGQGGQGDKGTGVQGDKGTRGQGEKGTRGQGDKGDGWQGDKGTGVRGVGVQEDKETRRQGDKGTRGQEDKRTRGQGDKGTRRQGDRGTGGPEEIGRNGEDMKGPGFCVGGFPVRLA